MRLQVQHSTKYSYSLPARSNINELRLSPEENARQKPGAVEFTISPTAKLNDTRDLYGNLVHHFEVEELHAELAIQVVSEVETASNESHWQSALETPLSNLEELQQDEFLHDFLTDSTYIQRDPETWKEAVDVQLEGPKTFGGLAEALSDFVFKSCDYREQWIHRMRTASSVQKEKFGTCQDFAHLFISYCRALGVPARYMSGYLHDPGLEHQLAAEFVGAGQTHAWAEVFVPSVGWVGIDPTNQKWVDEHYISVAFGRDYQDVAPIRGSLIGGGKKRSLSVDLQVRKLA